MSLENHFPEPLLKASQVAKILNISRAFAYQLMQKGEFPIVRIRGAVRVKLEDLKRYIEAKRSSQAYVVYNESDHLHLNNLAILPFLTLVSRS